MDEYQDAVAFEDDNLADGGDDTTGDGSSDLDEEEIDIAGLVEEEGAEPADDKE